MRSANGEGLSKNNVIELLQLWEMEERVELQVYRRTETEEEGGRPSGTTLAAEGEEQREIAQPEEAIWEMRPAPVYIPNSPEMRLEDVSPLPASLGTLPSWRRFSPGTHDSRSDLALYQPGETSSNAKKSTEASGDGLTPAYLSNASVRGLGELEPPTRAAALNARLVAEELASRYVSHSPTRKEGSKARKQKAREMGPPLHAGALNAKLLSEELTLTSGDLTRRVENTIQV
ncbi:MAG: hypothetical protein SGPRY_011865 [Prymnesium sp.]